MNKQIEKTVLDPTEARQAITGHNVNAVLTVSLTLAVLAGIVLVGWFWFLR